MSTANEDTRPTQPQTDASAAGNGSERGEPADKPSPLKNPRVKWTLAIVGGLVLLALLVWFAHWLLVGRHLQSTNNAYLKADAVAVSPRVNGYVTRVLVRDNQWVKAGEPLLEIDDRTYRAQLRQAEAVVQVREADIAAAEANVAGQASAQAQARTQVASAQASVKLAKAEVARFAPLAATGADTQEHVDALRHDLARAQAGLEAAQAQVDGAQQQSRGAAAQLEQAKAALAQARADAEAARLAVDDTRLFARIDGRIGDRTVQVGQFVGAGTRTMTIMPVGQLYLVANFKETQLDRMRPGQPVEVEVDALPGRTLRGTVESLSPGTGSQFALLPAENATGNFTKVVQRVPVRIRLQADAAARQVLVPGMSAEVTVDTRERGNDAARERAGADGAR